MPEQVASRRPKRVLILGCGYTGIRVARTLASLGISVVATRREMDASVSHAAEPGIEIHPFDALNPADLLRLPTLVDSCEAVVFSIPTLRLRGALVERLPDVVRSIPDCGIRCIYLSTTGVYGNQHQVDASTFPAPGSPREWLRTEAENSILSTFPSSLVLRPAAIYGPGRGVHVSMREGRYRLTGDGSNYISRIHVDDLAAHVVAALRSSLRGAWPVADESPSTQREMAAFCASLLGLPMPPRAEPGDVSETLRANRRVDGAAVRKLLAVTLRYPSFREGVPASIREEELGRASNP
ncbi:MAG: hypothetical protein KJZ70_18275 [Bryobacterales bacterium]|nr:hypothetical protein [Bryobacterales bacterium]